jgi:(p)ppGpp synthase/HD superfamily hydrolase
VAAHWRYKESSTTAVQESSTTAFHERHVLWARFVLSWQSELLDHKVRASCVHHIASPLVRPSSFASFTRLALVSRRRKLRSRWPR